MILSAILALPFLHLPTADVSETKLFKILKGKVSPNSIAVSTDLLHYSYSTTDNKVNIDGKVFGPYLSNGLVIFSGNNADYAFLASQKAGAPSSLIFNGSERKTEYPVSNLFRAGETGGLCWVERNQELTRLVYPGGTTAWFEKIEKLNFSDDGSLFALRISEKAKVLPGQFVDKSAPTSQDFIVQQDGSKIPRENILQVFPAPNSQGYATLTTDNWVNFRTKRTSVTGEFYGKPLFSPDGKQFAYRNSFTRPTPDGKNVAFYQYTIGGYPYPDLQVQTGLTFAPDGKKWVMCGYNGKTYYLYVSSMGMVPYSDFPNLNGAPPEAYKEARFVNGNIVLLFQPKRANPTLFIEEKGLFDLGLLVSAPETMSISPDGRFMLIGCSDRTESRAFVVNLENPGPAVELLKPGYDLQNLGKRTFIWKSAHEVQFLILRNQELARVTAKL